MPISTPLAYSLYRSVEALNVRTRLVHIPGPGVAGVDGVVVAGAAGPHRQVPGAAGVGPDLERGVGRPVLGRDGAAEADGLTQIEIAKLPLGVTPAAGRVFK
jgi:hypothetical protein